jgi:hypothetical protein
VPDDLGAVDYFCVSVAHELTLASGVEFNAEYSMMSIRN